MEFVIWVGQIRFRLDFWGIDLDCNSFDLENSIQSHMNSTKDGSLSAQAWGQAESDPITKIKEPTKKKKIQTFKFQVGFFFKPEFHGI